MKGTSVHIKNMRIKQLCSPRVRDFAMALRARKVSKAFEKRAPGSSFLPEKLKIIISSFACNLCVGSNANTNLDHHIMFCFCTTAEM